MPFAKHFFASRNGNLMDLQWELWHNDFNKSSMIYKDQFLFLNCVNTRKKIGNGDKLINDGI